MATILLLEPHPLLRLGLRHLLAQAHMPGDLIDVDPAVLADPDPWTSHADLLIYGLPTDAAAGWETLGTYCRQLSPQRVLVLAEHVPPVLPEGGLPEPVRGLLAKACSADALEAAIRLVLAGGECFPSQLPAMRWGDLQASQPAMQHASPFGAGAPSRQMPVSEPRYPSGHPSGYPSAPIVVPLHSMSTVPGELPVAEAHGRAASAPPETPAAGAHLLNITERQYEVLALLARGYPIKTVSRLLNISVATAKTHACTLYQRLHVRNKGEAVYVALQRGATLNWPGPSVTARPATASMPLREACEAA
ncbi:LuxR C-terminal-related transcriptional regulator [Cupriavidus plantarum]|uniref:LuxR C-terminal-related transcriptional regulator n=1 Tax=Cupriavidus plantarum TaxID=942865 RepID=UPI000EB14E02|nr:LuxR C-terminal-related transcriptional regulator [Cupriavidus plantarum]RLK31099.1 DNA-binding NarL/FixJ family response regulator [Cupriavidus plantarum]